MSEKLPKIRLDPDTERRYVMVGRKRIWLAKGVTKKTLLKFLLKLRRKIKRSTRKRRKSTPKKVQFKPALFGENVARSMIGNAALSLASKALVNSAVKPSGGVDTDKIDEDIKAIKALIKANDGKDAIIPYKGLKIGRKELEQLEVLHGDLAGQLIEAKEDVKAAKEEKKASDRNLVLEKRINKLKEKVEKAKKDVLTVARQTLTKKNTGKPLSKFLTDKAKQYGIKGSRIDDLLKPVVYQMLNDDELEFSDFENVVEAAKTERRLKRELKDTKKSREVAFSAEEKRPQARIHNVEENKEEEEEESEHEAAESEQEHEEYELNPDILARARQAEKIAARTRKELEHFERNKKRKVEEIESDDPLSMMRQDQPNLDKARQAEAMAAIWADHDALVAKRGKEAEEYKRQYPDQIAEIEEKYQDYLAKMRDFTQSKIDKISKPQAGDGRRKVRPEEGLSTSQIDSIMKAYPGYMGCIGSDQILDLKVEPKSRFGFVMNTDPSYKPGEHWVAVFVDARPNGTQSIEYYDSLADLPTRQVFNDLKEMVNSLQSISPLLFKMNKVADQSDNSTNCGYFSTKFLIERFNGKSFAEASGYNQRYPEGERQIEAWKKHFGIEKFRPIEEQSGEGFRDVIRSGIDYVKRGVESVKQRVKDVMQGVRKHASPAVRSWLEKYGDMEVVEMKICRKPIFSVIEKLANLLSNGRWEENKEKLSYDRLMHLFVLIKIEPDGLDNPAKVFKIEKNHVVEIRSGNWNTDNDTETIPFTVHTHFKMGRLFSAAEKRVGADKLWIYDARTQNCQYFIKWVFGLESGWTSSVETFVMQDAEKVLEGMGLLGKIAKVVTDVAGVGDVALNGAGRRGRGGRR